MATTTVSFEVENGFLEDVKDMYWETKPVDTIPDPDWEDPKDGSVSPQIPKFTRGQWAKECMRRNVRDDMAIWKQKKDRDAIKFEPEKYDDKIS